MSRVSTDDRWRVSMLWIGLFLLMIGLATNTARGVDCPECQQPNPDYDPNNPYEPDRPCIPTPDGPIEGAPCKECKDGEVEHKDADTDIPGEPCMVCDGGGQSRYLDRTRVCPSEYNEWSEAVTRVDMTTQELSHKDNECRSLIEQLVLLHAERALKTIQRDNAWVTLYAMRMRYAVECQWGADPDTDSCKTLDEDIRAKQKEVDELEQGVHDLVQAVAAAEAAAKPCLDAIKAIQARLQRARQDCTRACQDLDRCLKVNTSPFGCVGCPSYIERSQMHTNWHDNNGECHWAKGSHWGTLTSVIIILCTSALCARYAFSAEGPFVISGTVSTVNGQPLAGADIFLMRGGVTFARSRSDDHGSYVLTSLCESARCDYILRAWQWKRLFATNSYSLSISPGEAIRRDFVEVPGGTVSGFAKRVDGVSLTGVRVEFRRRDSQDIVNFAETRDDGGFEIYLPSGSLRLLAFLPSGVLRGLEIFAQDVEVPVGGVAHVDIVAAPGRRIAGALTTTSGLAPEEDARVTLVDLVRTAVVSKVIVPAGQGNYSFSSVTPGRYLVMAEIGALSINAYCNLTITQDVTTLNIVVTNERNETQSSISGAIRMADGSALSGSAVIALMDTENMTMLTTINVEPTAQSYSIGGLSPGHYGLMCMVGTLHWQTSISLSAGQVLTNLDVILGGIERGR